MKALKTSIILTFILIFQVKLHAQTSPVKAGYAPVNGLKMYYEVHGEGAPLVLIHGSFMTIPMNWEQLIPLFKNRKIVVAEMQGHGRTADIPRAFSYENMADDVSELLRYLKIDSTDVLGYSMGGGVAFQMGIRHPKQVKKLVIISGAYKNDGWWPETEESFATMNAAMFKGSPLEEAYKSLSPHPEKFEEFFTKTMSIDLKPYDWTEDVRKMTIPILMLIGDSDGIRYEHANELMRMKGGAKMGDFGEMSTSRMAVLPGTTHIGMMTRASWWIPMMDEFLDNKKEPSIFME
ncbi:alpha/beta hydrolase [Olivibacter sp. CPCC 100613]|uniref:alpha/beta fold hydrolase n=1 Tax=Olivibacter sp. CPCC 100613 TaxID=3079931 RepID=UPI002FF7ACD3